MTFFLFFIFYFFLINLYRTEEEISIKIDEKQNKNEKNFMSQFFSSYEWSLIHTEENTEKIRYRHRKSSRRIAEESTGRGNVCACVCAGYTCAGVRVRAY